MEQVGDGTEQTLFLWVPENLTFFRPPQLTATLSPVVRTGGAQKKKEDGKRQDSFSSTKRSMSERSAVDLCCMAEGLAYGLR